MPRQPSLTFANVICHFGPDMVLLDLAQEVVLPAFNDSTLRRKFGETVFLFLKTGWAVVPARDDATDEICLFGQFVKDTILHRDQILEGDRLITNHDSIPSAPSAFFVLMLSNHKLIYLPETPYAPSLDSFGATMQHFLREKHRDFIDAEYRRREGTLYATSKLNLLSEYPSPTVEVMPLASRESIEQFVASIARLTHLEFRILDTNREFQMRGPYEKIRQDKGALGAKTSKLIYDNSDGMSKAEAAHQIELSAASGNQAVIVAGTADDGTKVRGNNEKFRMQVPVEELPGDPQRKTFRLLEIFRDQAANGNVALDAGLDNRDRIAVIKQRLLGGGNGRPRP